MLTVKIRRRAELFRTEKLALGARYAAARASVRATEHVTGLSDEAAEGTRTVERARDAARDILARAAALAEVAGLRIGDLPGDEPGDGRKFLR